nr:hypothetical protein [Tanacetum cinerariifolium]
MEQPDSLEAAPQSPIQTPPVPQDEDEREPMFIQPHDPDYVPEPMYPEYIPLEDEYVLPAEEQPLPPVVSPTAESPEYVAESDPEEDPKEERLARCTTPSACPSPPPVPSPLLPSSGCPTQIQTLRLASTQALIDAVIAAIPSPPLPPPLYIPPHVDRKDDIPEIKMTPRKRFCLSTLGSRYEIGESFTTRPIRDRGIDYGFVSTLDAEARRREIGEVGYGIRDTWVDPAETVPEITPMTVGERVDLLMEDRIAHQETIQIVKEEAYAAREAWAHSIGLSQAVHSKLQTDREQASSTYGRDSLSDGRHEMRDG